MIIGIDFDSTLNELLDVWVMWLNRAYGFSVKPEDITDWELGKAYPWLTKEELYMPLNTPEFWDEVQIKQDAAEILERLMAEGHEVYIITSSYYKVLPFKLKRCLFKHFPFINHKQVIITYNKALIMCDVLIDDGLHNLKGSTAVKVVFDAPYNRGPEAKDIVDYRVGSWKEVYVLIRGLMSDCNGPSRFVRKYKAGRGQGKTAWLQEELASALDKNIPCYLIMSNNQYKIFCNDFLARYGKRCTAKLHQYNLPVESNAVFFVDMPSMLPVRSEAFSDFVNIVVTRQHFVYLTDFENTFWPIV